MKHWFYYIVILLAIVSCSTPQQIYVSDAERDYAEKILNTYKETIHLGDQLYIYVYSTTPEATISFNQETMTQTIPQVRAYRNFAKDVHNISGYTVSQDGCISFPVLGSIYVNGLTYDTVEQIIQKRLVEEGYINEPVVTVSSMNFRVSVVGAVASPQEIHVQGERLTILEALAMCGDITMSGQRQNVVVMRDIGGSVVPIEIDLTRKTMFDSEVYYLQSNDIVYVEPNNRMKKKSYRNGKEMSYITLGISVARLIMLLERRYYRLIQ